MRLEICLDGPEIGAFVHTVLGLLQPPDDDIVLLGVTGRADIVRLMLDVVGGDAVETMGMDERDPI